MAISGESVSSAERMMNVGQQRDLLPTSQVAKFFVGSSGSSKRASCGCAQFLAALPKAAARCRPSGGMRHHLRDHAAVEWALALLLPGGAPENPNRSSTPSRDRKEMAEVVFCLITEPDILDPPHRQHHERIQSFNKLIGCRLYLFAIANDFVHHLGRGRAFCRPLSRRQY